jgi:general secretion pathway protein C
MTSKWWAFGLWAAVAATGTYWGLKLGARTVPMPAHTQVVAAATPVQGDLSRLLGHDPVPQAEEAAPASARFQLIGVVAARGATAPGVALIAIDGRMPKAYRVGAVVEGDTVLQSVAQRGASLGPRGGAATVALNIPPPAPAATGQLPAAAAPGGLQPNPPQAMPGRPGFVPPPRVNAPPAVQQPQMGDDRPSEPPGPSGGLPTQ